MLFELSVAAKKIENIEGSLGAPSVLEGLTLGFEITEGSQRYTAQEYRWCLSVKQRNSRQKRDGKLLKFE